jgi:hypothetical protein
MPTFLKASSIHKSDFATARLPKRYILPSFPYPGGLRLIHFLLPNVCFMNWNLGSKSNRITPQCACSSAGLERRSPEPKVAGSNPARRTIKIFHSRRSSFRARCTSKWPAPDDSSNPDLGGCFRPTCKVAGGWDFAHNDADPMDADGHGTHVAGIVAANGNILGVAKDATLFAYKVLDKYGDGEMADVIS